MSVNAFQRVLFVVLCLFFTGGWVACQAEEVITVGVVNFVPAMDPVLDGFKAGMVEFEYIEGENITYIYGGPAGNPDELSEIADGLVEADVDIILALSTPAALAAKRATAETRIPVVFVPVTDPVGTELVKTLSQPGGNVTGITNGGSESRRLEWLLELAPEMQQVYVPYNPEDASAKAALQAVEAAADELGVELVTREAIGDDQMTAAIHEIPADIDALFMLPDSRAIDHIEEFVAQAIEHQLPFSGPTTAQAKAGALVSFGVDFFSAGKQAARLADQILRGTDPAVLPVEEGEFFLTINLKTAEAIGLEISDAILNQANEIIRE